MLCQIKSCCCDHAAQPKTHFYLGPTRSGSADNNLTGLQQQEITQQMGFNGGQKPSPRDLGVKFVGCQVDDSHRSIELVWWSIE